MRLPSARHRTTPVVLSRAVAPLPQGPPDTKYTAPSATLGAERSTRSPAVSPLQACSQSPLPLRTSSALMVAVSASNQATDVTSCAASLATSVPPEHPAGCRTRHFSNPLLAHTLATLPSRRHTTSMPCKV
jgi:hypothetical protein